MMSIELFFVVQVLKCSTALQSHHWLIIGDDEILYLIHHDARIVTNRRNPVNHKRKGVKCAFKGLDAVRIRQGQQAKK